MLFLELLLLSYQCPSLFLFYVFLMLEVSSFVLVVFLVSGLVLYAMGSWSGSCYSMFACIVMWCRFSLMTLSAFLFYGSGSLAIVVFG